MHVYVPIDWNSKKRKLLISLGGLQNVRIVDNDKLIIIPPDVDRGKLYFYLHSLRNMLPKVVVKVHMCWILFAGWSQRIQYVNLLRLVDFIFFEIILKFSCLRLHLVSD